MGGCENDEANEGNLDDSSSVVDSDEERQRSLLLYFTI